MPGPIPARKHGRKIRVCAAKRRRYGAGPGDERRCNLGDCLSDDPDLPDQRFQLQRLSPDDGPIRHHGDLRAHANEERRRPDDAADDGCQQSQPLAVPVGLGAGLTNAARLVLGDRQIQRPLQRRQQQQQQKVTRQRLYGRQQQRRQPHADLRHNGRLLSEMEPRRHPVRHRERRRHSLPLQYDLHPRRRRADRQYRRRRCEQRVDVRRHARRDVDRPAADRLCRAAELANWNGPNTPIQYSENYNYIFLNALNDTGFVSSPLELDASISSFDPQYEGRAPDISPTAR